jgi:hypothetical protein
VNINLLINDIDDNLEKIDNILEEMAIIKTSDLKTEI